MTRLMAPGMKCLVATITVCLLPTLAVAAWDGTVQWSKRVALGTPVSGVVKSVLVTVGQRVKRGQVMMELDDTPFVAAVERVKAEVASLKQARLEALRELNRAKELFERESLSTVARDQARLRYVQADAAHKKAEADAVTARYRFEHSRIKAPFNGVVVERRVEVGQNVISELQSDALIVFASTDSYVAQVFVSADEVVNITLDSAANVEVDGRDYHGRVRAVGVEPVSNPAAQAQKYLVAV